MSFGLKSFAHPKSLVQTNSKGRCFGPCQLNNHNRSAGTLDFLGTFTLGTVLEYCKLYTYDA